MRRRTARREAEAVLGAKSQRLAEAQLKHVGAQRLAQTITDYIGSRGLTTRSSASPTLKVGSMRSAILRLGILALTVCARTGGCAIGIEPITAGIA